MGHDVVKRGLVDGRDAAIDQAGANARRLDQQSAARLAGGCFAGRAEQRRARRRATPIRPLHQRARCHTIRAGAYASPGSATGWPVITAVSLAEAKQPCHVDELGDARKSSAARAGIGAVQAAALPAEAGVSPSPAGALLPLLRSGSVGSAARSRSKHQQGRTISVWAAASAQQPHSAFVSTPDLPDPLLCLRLMTVWRGASPAVQNWIARFRTS